MQLLAKGDRARCIGIEQLRAPVRRSEPGVFDKPSLEEQTERLYGLESIDGDLVLLALVEHEHRTGYDLEAPRRCLPDRAPGPNRFHRERTGEPMLVPPSPPR